MALRNPLNKNDNDNYKEKELERTTIPRTINTQQNSNDKNVFNSLLNSDDDEEDLLYQAKVNKTLDNFIGEGDDPIAREIEENAKALRKQDMGAGIKSIRYITTDILMKAPANYFDRYESDIKRGVDFVRESLAEGAGNNASIIRQAQENPTDEALQNKAYYIVSSIVSEYTNSKSPWRDTHRLIVVAMICNEILGFGRLETLWRDDNIDEILCNGPYDIQVEIRGELYQVHSCKFRDVEHMAELISRLYGAINKVVAQNSPIVDGRLHDNSRMAVVHQSVAPNGPNFSIRKHKEEYITPEQLIKWGSANEELMTFLGNLVHKGCSILILGGTSSGKTTLLGALSGFFRLNHRILTLEDNLELKLPHNKLLAAPMECIDPQPDRPNSGVSMRDLVKASLRQRPDAIVVGEVRDGSAYDLCQAFNTGHYGMSTVHANSEKDGIYRLVSLVSQGGLMQGNAALPLIASSFDIIVRIDKFAMDGSRKIVSVSEVSAYPKQNKQTGEIYLPTHQLWKFVNDGLGERNKVLGHWEKTGELSQIRREIKRLDIEKDLTWEELKKLSEG